MAPNQVKFQSTLPLGEQVLLDDDSRPSVATVDAILLSPEGVLRAGDPPLLSRSQKKVRKGLPSHKDLCRLAQVWLELAHQLWPEAAAAGQIPRLSDTSVRDLAADFERRFITGVVDAFNVNLGHRIAKQLAAIYCRYSDDSSNPRSLDDQLTKAMKKAKESGCFVPWEYVFADASVTGRTQLRRGYRLAKEAMEKLPVEASPDMLLVDDFSRAARNAIETYRLAKLMQRLGRTMIGVSDGFDLRGPSADMLLMVVATFNEVFVKQLRDKVIRGMIGAAGRGTSTGKVRFGFKLVPFIGLDGKVVMRDLGSGFQRPIRTPAIDEEAMALVLTAARWFADDLLAYKEIARRFNAMRAAGGTNWKGPEIAKMLRCPLFIGVLIYNKTRTAIDWDTGEFSVVPNPRREWVITKMPHLRHPGWTDELWRRVRRRAALVRANAPMTNRKHPEKKSMPRCDINALYPTTLTDGILVCGCCQRELRLVRSDGKYKQLGCPHGFDGLYGCTLKASKSTRIVEEALLAYIAGKVLLRDRVVDLVEKANAFLTIEAVREKVDTAPVAEALKRVQAEEAGVVDFVMKNMGRHDMTAYLTRGDQLRVQIAKLRDQLRELEAKNAVPPPPLVTDEVVAHLEDLRGLLNESVGKSNGLLKALLGRVTISQVKEPGKTRMTWVAQVRADVLRLAAYAAKERDYPDRETWEFLKNRNWTNPQTVEVVLARVPQYEARAAEVRRLLAAGACVNQIATFFSVPWKTAREYVEFATTGKRPVFTCGTRTGTGGKSAVYIEISGEVVRRRARQEPFPVIAKALGFSEKTVVRAYDYANHEAVAAATAEGRQPDRGRYRGVTPEKLAEIKRRLRAGETCQVIAQAVGCGASTVSRVRQTMGLAKRRKERRAA